MKAGCAPDFADSSSRLCVLDMTIKDKAFCLNGVYALNNPGLISFVRSSRFWLHLVV